MQLFSINFYLSQFLKANISVRSALWINRNSAVRLHSASYNHLFAQIQKSVFIIINWTSYKGFKIQWDFSRNSQRRTVSGKETTTSSVQFCQLLHNHLISQKEKLKIGWQVKLTPNLQNHFSSKIHMVTAWNCSQINLSQTLAVG